ncbi:MAG: hypothetical protein A2360_03465 [Candidatus Staskawiczbacteria bacterium RIFOXYB1_FULL_32_11]|nr:MAG: hypothetical protein UR22_C0015G0007 [Parcubacteria group bacterium GW2011_GWC2_32_10]OGZ80913.1 MAG: hypothetical protein A2360_03465 [Candidatus Staskawiczbacteria bacterium RIFOXYB1_FULL_32_11]
MKKNREKMMGRGRLNRPAQQEIAEALEEISDGWWHNDELDVVDDWDGFDEEVYSLLYTNAIFDEGGMDLSFEFSLA